MRKLLFIFLLAFSTSAFAQKVYRTQIFDENIKSLQIGVNDEKYLLPIIELNGPDVLMKKMLVKILKIKKE
jgi:flavorubredoxin